MTPQKFWMVWLKDSPTTRKRHCSCNDAFLEADRVARLRENTGRKVYVLEAIDYRVVDEQPLTRGEL